MRILIAVLMVLLMLVAIGIIILVAGMLELSNYPSNNYNTYNSYNSYSGSSAMMPGMQNLNQSGRYAPPPGQIVPGMRTPYSQIPGVN
jgi:hypothetical protein